MFKRRQPAPPVEAPLADAKPAGITADDVVAAMEMILGRTPDQALIDQHLLLGLTSRFQLGEYLLRTDEFRSRGHKFRSPPIFLGDRVMAHTYMGYPIFLVPTDLNITPPILTTGTYEPHVHRALLNVVRNGDIAIDLGSNIGFHTLIIGARVGQNGRVHAFEANPELIKLLKATLQLNSLGTIWNSGIVKLYNMAVADRAGTFILEQAPEHYGSGHLVTDVPTSDFGENYSVRIEVPTVAIDELLGGEIEKLDFLHMDIEGAEPLAIRGARALISRSPNLRIVTEWSVGMMKTMADVPDCIDWLAGEGFRFWRLDRDNTVEAVAVADLMNQPHCDMFISRQDPPAF